MFIQWGRCRDSMQRTRKGDQTEKLHFGGRIDNNEAKDSV